MQHQAVDKMFWLEPGPLSVTTRNVVYLCRPKMSHMRTIAGEPAISCSNNIVDQADLVSAQLRATQSTPSSSGPLHFTILLVPRATELCRKVLEDEGVAGDVTISEVRN